MRLRYREEEEAFRAELLAWVEANVPPDDVLRQPKQSSANFQDWSREWQRTLFDAGWLVPGWPPELGGRNAGPAEQMIYFEELARREIPRSLNPQGLGIVAPSIRDYGTPEQQERFLVPTLRAETDWCLCFVRTDPAVPKHKGISALIIDMTTPGIECRPFPELSEPDYYDFNEVFFTDVVVPRDHLVGELIQGWPITQGSLAHERAMLWIDYAYLVDRGVRELIGLSDREGPNGPPLRDDPRFRDQVAGFYI